MKYLRYLLLLSAVAFISCSPPSALQRIQDGLEQFPEYSIVLEDMEESGNFFPDYFHRYKVVYGEKIAGQDSLSYKTYTTDWEQVKKKEFERYADFLGMTLVSKSAEAGLNDTPQPPGYQYVGNTQYGQWRTDSSGNSFWEWYGRYAFFSHMFGMFNRPVYRGDYDDYRRYRSDRRPYFGRGNTYGTSGSYTKQTKKSFYERRQSKMSASKSRFGDKVRQRVKRSNMSGFRSRSGGFGK